ncbi:IS21 family transposase [Kitasatospora sp. NPDC056138]|uniref:Mu transposase domain-containing protein n=1 Tax=Kitasatospora sp. NPDC056138 TaxID=3345724 RepID=UPI0035DF2991
MLTKEEYSDVRELRRQGWSISAIARHLGRDRKTVRAYLDGDRIAGVRSPVQDEYSRFLPYTRQRLIDDPHLPASVLYDEAVALGYPGGYSTFTRALRRHRVRPPCELCRPDRYRGHGTGLHLADEAVRFEWLRLPDPPAHWGYGDHALLLTASLAGRGRWRGVLAESTDFPELLEAVDQVIRRIGGTTGRWQFDRTPAVCCPTTGRVTPAFADAARYYGAEVDIRPAGRAGRTGRSDAEDETGEAGRRAVRRWWRALPGEIGLWAAQDRLDRLAGRMDGRRRPAGDPAAAARAPALADLPDAPFPVRIHASRTVTSQGQVSYRGNYYPVPADLSGAVVRVCRRLDEPFLSITTASGAVIARHALAPQGAGLTLTGRGRAIVLDRTTRTSRTDAPPPCRLERVPRPLSREALAEARALRGPGVAAEHRDPRGRSGAEPHS